MLFGKKRKSYDLKSCKKIKGSNIFFNEVEIGFGSDMVGYRWFTRGTDDDTAKGCPSNKAQVQLSHEPCR